MAVEVLTISLGVDVAGDSIRGRDLISGDKDDNQIVTVEDGGDLNGNLVFSHWGKDAATEAGAGAGGDDEFHFDLSGFDDDFSISVKSMDPGDNFVFTGFDSYSVNGNEWTFHYTGSDGNPHSVTIDVESTNGTGIASVVVCFAKGSKIRVPGGDRLIESLQAGDHVICGDGQPRPIRWIGYKHLDAVTLETHPNLRPVTFAANSLARGCPAVDLKLSPQHRVLLKDWRAELLFGESEVLVPAISLLNDRSIRQPAVSEGVDYYHILLEGHHTVWANGVECETLMPAAMAQASLSGAARDEILQIFPEIASDIAAYGNLCRPALKQHEAQVLMGDKGSIQQGR